MGKTLFISDLDGTLLNSDAVLSDLTVETINRLTAEGIYFTYATARTVYTAFPKTKRLDISVPCILNNGSSVYDSRSKKFVKKAFIPQETAARLIDAFRSNDVGCMMLKFAGDTLLQCVDDYINTPGMLAYIAERRVYAPMRFIECDDIRQENDSSAVYITANGDYEKMLPVYRTVKEIAGADCAFYKDSYTDYWYLETFSEEASKANGVKFLRERYGFDRVVAFGDNYNDLSMFSQADIKVAVGNAVEEIRRAADFIADTNDNDGVAKFLEDQADKFI